MSDTPTPTLGRIGTRIGAEASAVIAGAIDGGVSRAVITRVVGVGRATVDRIAHRAEQRGVTVRDERCRSESMLERTGQAAELALERTIELLQGQEDLTVRDAAITYGILVDKRAVLGEEIRGATPLVVERGEIDVAGVVAELMDLG